jgi:hypothetical protein
MSESKGSQAGGVLRDVYQQEERSFPFSLVEKILEVETSFQFTSEREVPLVRLRRIVETHVSSEMEQG